MVVMRRAEEKIVPRQSLCQNGFLKKMAQEEKI